CARWGYDRGWYFDVW
nr:immunoglobulin heavy chain junction region [Mus musculus]